MPVYLHLLIICMTKVASLFENEKQEALTKVARLFELEKQEALTKAARQYEEDKEEAVEKEKQKAAESYKHIVISMIQKNYTTNEIVSLVTDYSREQVDALRKSVTADTKDAQ